MHAGLTEAFIRAAPKTDLHVHLDGSLRIPTLIELAEALPVTRRGFRNLILAGFKGSFFPGPYAEKRAFVRRVIDRDEALERTMLPAA